MLFHLLAWLTVLLLFALWSGLCAVAHAVLTWEGWRGSIDWQLALPKFELPDWLAQWLGLDWVESLRAWLVEIGPSLHAWLTGLPDLGAWLGTAVWIVWGAGSLLLLLLGGAASGLIALVRRSSPKPSLAAV